MQVDLRGVLTARQRVELLNERIVLLRSAMETGERILRNGSGSNYATDRLSRDMAKLDELQRNYIDAVLDYDREVMITEDVIARLPDDEQTVIRLRYIGGRSWHDVTVESGIPMSQCYFLHKRALKALGLWKYSY